VGLCGISAALAYAPPENGFAIEQILDEFVPWQRPTPDVVADLNDPVNLQHVAAAWIVGGFR
jgi:hypothetical protein